ncbi:MAG: hypothetical protein AB1558_05890, partial [Thermodesulfobacteriota bacterium]
ITFTDITQSKTLEAELLKMQAELEKQIGRQRTRLEQAEQQLHDESKPGKAAGPKTRGHDRNG